MLEIYKATTFTELISEIQNSRRRGTTKFSYRQLADMLGYRSPRTLAMIHKGQRLPNQNLVRKIIYNFGLSPHEIEFTFLLVEKSFAEKKNLPTVELDEKLLLLRNLLKAESSAASNILAAEEIIFLKDSDLDSARKILTNFLLELATTYSNSADIDSRRYKIKLKLSLDSS